MEYCHLWNVPEPAAKKQLGKYILEKYGLKESTSSSKKDELGNVKGYRFYSGLCCGKSPVAEHAEILVDYTPITQHNTVITQWIGDIDNDNTVNTGKDTILDIVAKLEAMYKYVQSRPLIEISWEFYKKSLKGQNAVLSVLSEKSGSIDNVFDEHSKNTASNKGVLQGQTIHNTEENQEQEDDSVIDRLIEPRL